MDYTGTIRQKGVTFPDLRYVPYLKGRISQVEVHEKVGKSVIGGKKAHKGQQMYFMVVKKSRKRSGFVIYLYLKNIAFTAVTEGCKVLN